MSYIESGDLLITHGGHKYIAVSADYVKSSTRGGEYMEDWTTFLAVDVLVPETGSRSWLRVADVVTVTKKS